MKKIALTAIFIFICLNIFSQEAKPCLFIGLYDKTKGQNCKERIMVHESVKDYAEYNQKRTKFISDHKTENPNSRFIKETESVIVYEYEKGIGGECSSTFIGIKTAATIENCNQQLNDQIAKFPKDFPTPPNVVFTWQGKGPSKSEYTKDFGGLKARFITANTNTKSLVLVQLANQTTDKLATILLRTDDGKMMVEYLSPGSNINRNYNTKKLEVQVIYQDYKAPKPTFDAIEFIKGKVREILINDNGELETEKGAPLGGSRL